MNSPISLILVFFIAKGTFGPFIRFSRFFLDFKSSSISSKAINASFFLGIPVNSSIRDKWSL